MPYGHTSHLAFYLDLYIGPLSGWGSLPLPNFILIFPRVEVCRELISIPIKCGRKGDDLRGLVAIVLDFDGKIVLSCVLFYFPCLISSRVCDVVLDFLSLLI
jgi:hypothetical protein